MVILEKGCGFMFIKKFMAATLSLGLICGGASLAHAGSEPINLVNIVRDNYTQMCQDSDFRHLCLMRIIESADESRIRESEFYMRKDPEDFKHKLVLKLTEDTKFQENYLKFLEMCGRNVKAYTEFLSKRPKALRWPPSWG